LGNVIHSTSGPKIPPPDWTIGRTWYQVHALRALGCPDHNSDPLAPEPAAHRLRDLLPWLDHVAALGAGGLLLTPIFASTTHGYDIVDPFRIDQRLGNEQDLDDLVAACHERDLRILLDGVFNHASRQFPPFADVLEHGRDSDSAHWFRLDFDGEGPDGFAYDTFEGHGHLVALNHDADTVADWAVDVACHWLARGIDGWRLDAAYAVPTTFWSEFSARVRERFPTAYLLGEVIHDDYPEFVTQAALHSVTQYELHKAIWSALNDRNLFELSSALERHATFCHTFVPHTFVGNHDVTRVLTRLDDPLQLGHALAVLFSVPGSPCVYYGDELGLRGRKEEREGGDDAVRPPLPTSPQPQDVDQASILDLHRHLTHLRRARSWLDTATLEIVDVANAHLRYRVSRGDRAIIVVLNVGPEPIAVDGHAIAGHGVGTNPATVAPNSWALLE
jgi:glycosidase